MFTFARNYLHGFEMVCKLKLFHIKIFTIEKVSTIQNFGTKDARDGEIYRYQIPSSPLIFALWLAPKF